LSDRKGGWFEQMVENLSGQLPAQMDNKHILLNFVNFEMFCTGERSSSERGLTRSAIWIDIIWRLQEGLATQPGCVSKGMHLLNQTIKGWIFYCPFFRLIIPCQFIRV
jgi:hypothetical protein